GLGISPIGCLCKVYSWRLYTFADSTPKCNRWVDPERQLTTVSDYPKRLFDRPDGEVDDEQCRDKPHQRVYLMRSSLAQSNHHEAYKPCANPIGDGVGEWHEDHRKKGRNGDTVVVKIDVTHLRGHQAADDHQRRCGRLG